MGFVNSRPLIEGLDQAEHIKLSMAVPSKLLGLLQNGEADVARARAYGATGVPFFVIDEKYGVSGAQPTEVFTQVLEKAWADTHPTIEVVGGGEESGPDGCAI